ncbi:hypothetical protein SH2C18_44600 [Clostridium sediminicola]|uniref:hypothetical protein n=1 Tax=Clostridium sediminicola TaxID=3114879 RepID=UPI0031F23D05
MQISLYIGTRKKKDRIVNQELSKFIEGDRSARIKDLILKGLIFEGNEDIDEKLLDVRYMMGLNVEVKTVKNNNLTHKPIKQEKTNLRNKNTIKETENIIPDFKKIRIKNSDVLDDLELEDRI